MTQREYQIVKNQRADGSVYFQLQWRLEGTGDEWTSLYSNSELDEVRKVRDERKARQAASVVVSSTVVE